MKTHTVLFLVGSLALIALSACAAAVTPPAPPTSTLVVTPPAPPTSTLVVTPAASPTPTPDFAPEARAMMDQYNNAMLKMDSQTIASFYLPDGAAFDNGQLQAQGPDAILKFLKSFDGVVRMDKYQTTISSVQVNGDSVIITGTFQQQYTLLANNQTGTSSGSFTVEWVRQMDGKWLIKKLETRE